MKANSFFVVVIIELSQSKYEATLNEVAFDGEKTLEWNRLE